MLRFAEEIMLLLLDDEQEKFVRVPDWSMRYSLAGAVLMGLGARGPHRTRISIS